MKLNLLKTTVCLLVLLGCMSCASSDPIAPVQADIYSAWGFQGHDDQSGITSYARLESLSGNHNGYLFGKDGSLKVRNSGWCGTPPLTYSNFDGTWVEEQEDCLILTYSNWEEPTNYRMVVISVTADQLKCRLTVVR